jgi:hypothetical protein
MWMTDYIREIKLGLVKHYPDKVTITGHRDGEDLLEVPDGVYPLTIEDKMDWVKIKGGRIFCCNFTPEKL